MGDPPPTRLDRVENGVGLSTPITESEELAARFLRDLWGYIVTQALGVVADLGVADAIGDASAVTIDELAAAVGAERGALYRTMRALASLGYFTETAPRTFGHSPLSLLLREGAPASLRHIARWNASEPFRAWSDFGAVVRSGSPAFGRVFGAQLFDYLSEHDERRETFNAGMAGLAAARLEVLLAEDWSDVRSLVDVGGGRGVLVPWRDSSAVAREVVGLGDDTDRCRAMCARAAEHGREMTWPAVARQYVESFSRALASETRWRLISSAKCFGA